MPKKIRELKAMLQKVGFVYRPAKGSHTFWTHPLIPDQPVTIAGKDGDDAPRYLEKQVNQVLEKLEEINNQKEIEEE
ncbi:MAG: type II toxin-antitoxin system HicA family toxin [Chlorogloeopsis fritschii C42_A2020_084]|jgi:predicted RNA binding protein YcfA (HicA-like mRNA interferase family)|uniref:type II toxin-antitoxin system HicA family toxin n=1 Tax=Chlorogloeopsis fritschii TaxID=1124 RepID=UPI0019ED3A11|nr:type II toxin-antitoxin system HicA family toxin [Chlorogloeopsis fritschii]MBF2009573.1 type II toxin-antitoxin system HicA family toxin [Chlorogloeopsis fritschii C42_A2020_084]